jgi:hypothetical protein
VRYSHEHSLRCSEACASRICLRCWSARVRACSSGAISGWRLKVQASSLNKVHRASIRLYCSFSRAQWEEYPRHSVGMRSIRTSTVGPLGSMLEFRVWKVCWLRDSSSSFTSSSESVKKCNISIEMLSCSYPTLHLTLNSVIFESYVSIVVKD